MNMQQWLWGQIGLCTHGVTTQVMLGVSLRARCDTTLVIIMHGARDVTPPNSTTPYCPQEEERRKEEELKRIEREKQSLEDEIKAKQQRNECTPEPTADLGKPLDKEGGDVASGEATMESIPEADTTQEVGVGGVQKKTKFPDFSLMNFLKIPG